MPESSLYCFHCMTALPAGCESCPACGHPLRQAEESPPHQLPPGTILSGRYLLGNALGEGGFGITYLGLDLTLDVKVAVKEFYPASVVMRTSALSASLRVTGSTRGEDFAEGKAKFLEEARVLAKYWNEPGIVSVQNYFEANNTVYLVMEYIDGVTLKEALKSRGPVPMKEALELMYPVMDALARVHADGILHRDVSPDNIMMLPDHRVKLLDFGAARRANFSTGESASVILKPGYAPEEQYMRKGVQGPWTDVYALCATLYRCVTGEVPEDSLERIHEDTLPTPLDLHAAISKGEQAVLMKGLSVEGKDRYQSMEALKAAFCEAEAGAAKASNALLGKTPRQMGGRRTDGVVPPLRQRKNQPPRENVSRQSISIAPSEETVAFQADSPAAADGSRRLSSRPSPVLGAVPGGQAVSPKKRAGRKRLLLLAGGLVVVFAAALLIFRFASHFRLGEQTFSVRDSYISVYSGVPTATQLAGLRRVKELNYLSLSGCNLDNSAVAALAAALSGSETLKGLSLGNNPAITDISPLKKITRLTSLDVSGTGISSIAPLSEMPELRSLQVSDTPCTDFHALLVLNKLETFQASNTAFQDTSLLSEKAQLSRVEVSGCPIGGLGFLLGKENLRELRASGCGVTNLTPLADLRKLETLSLSDNAISDVTPLAWLTAMEELDLSGNEITELSPIEKLTGLKKLYLQNNQIADLSFLKNMVALTRLDFSGNQVADISFLSGLKGLEKLGLANNRIEDLTPAIPFIKSICVDSDSISLDLSGNPLDAMPDLPPGLRFHTLNLYGVTLPSGDLFERLPETNLLILSYQEGLDYAPLWKNSKVQKVRLYNAPKDVRYEMEDTSGKSSYELEFLEGSPEA